MLAQVVDGAVSSLFVVNLRTDFREHAISVLLNKVYYSVHRALSCSCWTEHFCIECIWLCYVSKQLICEQWLSSEHTSYLQAKQTWTGPGEACKLSWNGIIRSQYYKYGCTYVNILVYFQSVQWSCISNLKLSLTKPLNQFFLRGSTLKLYHRYCSAVELVK